MQKSSLLLAAGLICASAVAHAGPITISVTPWLAPNVFGSPSFATAAQNAITAEMNGLSSYGAAGPTQFNAVSTVYAGEGVVTDFNSWKGQADPTGAYSQELGNRYTFALAINGNGSLFSISELSFDALSTDPFDALAQGFGSTSDPGDYGTGTYDYSDNYVGVIDNPDGSVTLVTSGPNTQKVNALYSRGSGNSFAALCPGCTPAQQQAAIDAVADYPGTPFTFTGTYSLTNTDGRDIADGSGTFNIVPTPEPSSLLLMGTGIAGLAGAVRRRLRVA